MEQQADELLTPNSATLSEDSAATPALPDALSDIASNDSAFTQAGAQNTGANPVKPGLKERIRHEAREIATIIVYLAISLCVLATLKCLILLQYGLDEFKNAYIMALLSALALGKIIVLAQKLPIVDRMKHRPIIWACAYKACFFTILMTFVHRAEERLVHSSVDPGQVFPLPGVICHQLSLFGIFFALFAYREVDRALGKGTLTKLLFKSRKTQNS